MEKSKNFEKYKKYHEAGWYTAEMLENLVMKEKLTQEEYEEIITAGETE